MGELVAYIPATGDAGTEYAINDKWHLKLEYLYVNLGKDSLFAKGDGYDEYGLSMDRKVSLQRVRVGLNYKF